MIGFSELTKKLDAYNMPSYLVLISKDTTNPCNILKRYRALLQFPDLNCIELDGNTADYNTIHNAIEKLPMMDTISIVIVTRAQFVLTDGKDKNKVVRSLNKLVVPHHCVLILQTYINEEENMRKNIKLPKLEKQGATVIYSPKFTLKEGIEELNRRHISLDNQIISYIYKNIGGNVDIFLSECEKIATLPNEQITDELLNSVVCKNDVNSVFDIVDALLKNKDLTKSLNILNDLIGKGTQPIALFATLHSQIKLLYHAKIYQINGRSSNEFADEFKIHSFRAEIGYNQSKSFSLEKLEDLFIFCNDMSEKLKLSSDSKLELDKIIIKLAK